MSSLSKWALRPITCVAPVRLRWWILLSEVCLWALFDLLFLCSRGLTGSALQPGFLRWRHRTRFIGFLFWHPVAVEVQAKAVHQFLLSGHVSLPAPGSAALLLHGGALLSPSISTGCGRKDLVHVLGEFQQSAFDVHTLTSTSIAREGGPDQRPGTVWPTVASLGRGAGVPLLFGLQLEGHRHAEVGVVNEAVGEHEVDADDGGQHIDLTDENEGQGEQAGETDRCHWSPVWASLLESETVSQYREQRLAHTWKSAV